MQPVTCLSALTYSRPRRGNAMKQCNLVSVQPYGTSYWLAPVPCHEARNVVGTRCNSVSHCATPPAVVVALGDSDVPPALTMGKLWLAMWQPPA